MCDGTYFMLLRLLVWSHKFKYCLSYFAVLSRLPNRAEISLIKDSTFPTHKRRPLQGCDAIWLGESFPTFPSILVPLQRLQAPNFIASRPRISKYSIISLLTATQTRLATPALKEPTLSFHTYVIGNHTAESPDQISSRSLKLWRWASCSPAACNRTWN
jgi:hypothetical protein